MKTLFHKWFLSNWQRKYFSWFIAIVAWFVINHSLTATKTINNIPVKIVNIPSNKKVMGTQNNGTLEKMISITFVGNKTCLDALNPSAFEVIVDATDKPDRWVESISKKNIIPLNSAIDIVNGISQVSTQSLTLESVKLITERLPIVITQPVGDPPRGYEFLDVWPYRMTLTVKGPEDVINKLKLKEHQLTFNLNDISKTELDNLRQEKSEVVSFQVPEHWKQISIPALSDSPILIDDAEAKQLRIDFARYDLLPLDTKLPINVFFLPGYKGILDRANYSLEENLLISKASHHDTLSIPLYAKGVSALFLEVVQEMMQLQVIVTPHGSLEWSVQFVNPRILEDEYVARLKSEISDEELSKDFQPILKEIYWRNRFRSYMSRFELFKEDGSKLALNIKCDKSRIYITENIEY